MLEQQLATVIHERDQALHQVDCLQLQVERQQCGATQMMEELRGLEERLHLVGTTLMEM